MKKIRIIFILLFVAATVFIFRNSSKSASESTVQSSFFVDFAEKYLSFIFADKDNVTHIIRKLAHFTEFFLQSAFLNIALFSKKYHKCAIYVLFTGLLTACTDEFIQLFFDGRGSMVSDIFVDFSGTLLSVLLFTVLWFIYNKKLVYKF